jgi:AcrR family transcriptional regulator
MATPASQPSRGPGRRPAGGDTRADILAAAQAEFAAKGYDGTTIRAVGAAAGVDAALVHHFFGSKDDLFLAALQIPFDPRVVLPRVLAAGVDDLGVRLVQTFLSIWEDPQARMPLLALVRSGLATESAGNLLADGMLRMIFAPVTQALGTPDAAVRVQLVASQMLGLVIARYVLALEPLASLEPDDLVALIGPTLQRYLTG